MYPATTTTTTTQNITHRTKNIALLGSFFVLGSSAWILVNGLYAEIPIIVAHLQYDYSIISKMTLCITLTSLAPIAWSLGADHLWSIVRRPWNKWRPEPARTKEEDAKSTTTTTTIGIGLLLILAVATSLTMALTDAALQETTLLLVSVCSGMVGTMSRVLYFPHASTATATATTNPTAARDNNNHEDPESGAATTTAENTTTDNIAPPVCQLSAIQQTTSMASGIGVGSLLVAILAIVQQMDGRSSSTTEKGNEERFTLQAYFGIVTGLLVLAMMGFVGTLVLNRPDTTRVQQDDNDGGVQSISPPAPPSSSLAANTAATTASELPAMENVCQDEKNSTAKQAEATSTEMTLLEQAPSSSTMTTPSELPPSMEIMDDGIGDAPRDVDNDNANHFQTHPNNRDNPPPPSSSSSSPAFLYTFWAITRQHATLNAGQFLLNALTFFLPGIVPYAIQHFEDSQRALHYLTVTQLIGQTLGAMASGWKQYRNVWLQLAIFGVLWIPTVLLSFVNNRDFQHTNQLHSAVPIALNAVLNFVYGYSSTTFYHLVHADAAAAASSVSEDPDNDHDDGEHDNHQNNTNNSGSNPHLASRVLGSWNQLGAMLGSLIAYFLVEKGAIS